MGKIALSNDLGIKLTWYIRLLIQTELRLRIIDISVSVNFQIFYLNSFCKFLFKHRNLNFKLIWRWQFSFPPWQSILDILDILDILVHARQYPTRTHISYFKEHKDIYQKYNIVDICPSNTFQWNSFLKILLKKISLW